MKNEAYLPQTVSRREFLKTSAAAATSVGTLTAGIGPVFAAGSDKIRVGLIGCGSRGVGAVMNCVLSTPGVEITALGDVFPDQVEKALNRLKDDTQPKEWSCSIPWKHSGQVKATKETCFSGVDAYRNVEVMGVGGRQWRVEPEFGNIYDHFGLRFRYPNGATVLSMARQINNCGDLVWEGVVGTKGRASGGSIEGVNAWQFLFQRHG